MSKIQKFDGVVLSGGGTKAIIQLGALHFYNEKGYLDIDYAKEYGGTSAGAIITLLLACGFEPMEIYNEVYTISNFFKPGGSPADFFDIIQNCGLISIEPAFEIIENLIVKKLGKVPTLRELLVERGNRYFATAFNVTKDKLEYLCPEKNPNMRSLDAAKLSSLLPPLFKRIKYKGCYYADGGLGDNFPIEAMRHTENKRILGITVTGVDQLISENAEMPFFNYFTRIALFPINTNTHLRSRNVGENVTLVSINVDNIPTLEFSIPRDRKMEMFMRGYTDAQRESRKVRIFVDGWDENIIRPLDGWDVDIAFEKVVFSDCENDD